MVTQHLTPNTTTPDATNLRDLPLRDLPLRDLVPSPYNPRRTFPDAELAALADSLKEHGVLQPLIVRPRPDPKIDRARAARGMAYLDADTATAREILANDLRVAQRGTDAAMELSFAFTPEEWTDAQEAYRLLAYESGFRLDLGPIGRGDTVDTAFLGMAPFVMVPLDTAPFEIIAGESRWRAAQLAGLTTVPCVVRDVDDQTAALQTLTENLERHNLDAIEEAHGFAVLASEFGLEQTEIGAKIQRSQAYVANRLRLLRLPPDVRALIAAGTLSAEHGRSLLRFEKFPAVLSAIATIAAETHAPVRTLDASALPFATELKRKQLTIDLASAEFPAETVCPSCPFGAYVKGETYYGFCLHLDHFDTLNREAIKAKQDARAAEKERQNEQLTALRQRQQAAASASATPTPTLTVLTGGTVTDPTTEAVTVSAPPPPPTLDDLSTLPHEILFGRQLPAGCTGECPCRLLAQDRNGKPTEVCTNPLRLHKLARDEKVAAENERKRRIEVALHRAQDKLDHLTTLDGRAMALLLVAVQNGFASSVGDRERCAEIEAGLKGRYGFAVPLGETRSAEDNSVLLGQLARRDPLTVLRYSLEYILRVDLPRALSDSRYAGGWSRWFLDLDNAPALPPPADTVTHGATISETETNDDDEVTAEEELADSLLEAERCPGCGRTFEQLETLDIDFDFSECLCETCYEARADADRAAQEAALLDLAARVTEEQDRAATEPEPEDTSDRDAHNLLTLTPLLATFDPDEDVAPVSAPTTVKRGRGRPRKSA